jgi:phosphatidylglycerol lysyltransferase
MRKQLIPVWVVVVVTLGSGLVNLFSVIGPGMPERGMWLLRILPLAFLHFSRFVTLLIGFALVVSSINIYKRKRRAFKAVLGLACGSIFFHLVKGLDYEEAALSLSLVFLLLLTRRQFTVRSGPPDVRTAIVRVAVAVVVALSYGIVGFWLLDRRHFGIDFTLADAMRRTLLTVSLIGDPQLAPHTRYAHWFLDSIYLLSFAAIGYAGIALFRPVVYRFNYLPHERELATKIVSRYGRSSLDFFKLLPDKSYFFSSSGECFLAYRVDGDFAVVLADPVGPEADIAPTVKAFSTLCEQNDWKLALYQTLPDFLSLYHDLGFKRLKIGDDAIVDLTSLTLEGRSMRKFRHRINHLEKEGVHIVRYDCPIPDDVLGQLKEVSDEWLNIPGRRERTFTVGRFVFDYIRSTPVVAAVDGSSRVQAFVNVVPSYHRSEASADLMRHRQDAPNGIMDYLFIKLFLLNKQQGYERFNLGMAPMAGFQEKEEASLQEKGVHYFFQHLNLLFSFTGLRQYKAKFATFWEPRYVVYRNVLDLPRLGIALRRITEAQEQGVDAGFLRT